MCRGFESIPHGDTSWFRSTVNKKRRLSLECLLVALVTPFLFVSDSNAIGQAPKIIEKSAADLGLPNGELRTAVGAFYGQPNHPVYRSAYVWVKNGSKYVVLDGRFSGFLSASVDARDTLNSPVRINELDTADINNDGVEDVIIAGPDGVFFKSDLTNPNSAFVKLVNSSNPNTDLRVVVMRGMTPVNAKNGFLVLDNNLNQITSYLISAIGGQTATLLQTFTGGNTFGDLVAPLDPTGTLTPQRSRFVTIDQGSTRFRRFDAYTGVETGLSLSNSLNLKFTGLTSVGAPLFNNTVNNQNPEVLASYVEEIGGDSGFLLMDSNDFSLRYWSGAQNFPDAIGQYSAVTQLQPANLGIPKKTALLACRVNGSNGDGAVSDITVFPLPTTQTGLTNNLAIEGQNTQVVGSGGCDSFAVGDMDLDGEVEAVVASGGSIQVYKVAGGSPYRYPSSQTAPLAPVSLDIDHSQQELIITSASLNPAFDVAFLFWSYGEDLVILNSMLGLPGQNLVGGLDLSLAEGRLLEPALITNSVIRLPYSILDTAVNSIRPAGSITSTGRWTPLWDTNIYLQVLVARINPFTGAVEAAALSGSRQIVSIPAL